MYPFPLFLPKVHFWVKPKENMNIYQLFVFIVFSGLLYSCNKENKAEGILDRNYVESIDFLDRSTLHDLNYERTRKTILPILKVFREEVIVNHSFERTLHCLDTLFHNRAFIDEYTDSIYQQINSPNLSKIELKNEIHTLLTILYSNYGYQKLVSQTERMGVIMQDTIYLPRNREYDLHEVVSREILDTILQIDVISPYSINDQSLSKISTFTRQDFIDLELKYELENPITRQKMKFKGNLVVRVIDL